MNYLMKKTLSLLFTTTLVLACVLAAIPASQPASYHREVTMATVKPSLPASHAAIVIDTNPGTGWSDVDIVTGTGASDDPYILDGVYIDCDLSGSGISVSGTADYAIIRNCYINGSGDGATDAAIAHSLNTWAN
jgi:hypothetical protein